MQVHVEAEHIQSRLADLGLKEERLAEVVQRGYVAFASCTPNDPTLFPGLSAWATMVRVLREYLLPEQWERCDDNNYPLVVNLAGTIAIAVATGDDATGLQDAMPTTKSAKGPSTVEAVASNYQQLELFPLQAAQPADQAEAEEPRMTWMLLVHRGQNEVRYELSLPTSMGEDGRVNGWRERIILGAIPTDPHLLDVTPPQPQLPDITVDVKRRA